MLHPTECKLYDQDTNLLTIVYVTIVDHSPEVMIWGDKVFKRIDPAVYLGYLVYTQVYAWWIPPSHK